MYFGNSPVSAKTGTTNDYKDNWTIGYTPSTLVAAWVGNNDSTPMSGLVSGITGAAPIFHSIMEDLLNTRPASFPNQPDSVIGKNVCADSGLFPTKENTCPTRFEYFIKGTESNKKTNISKKNVWVDKDTKDLAKPGQTENLELKEETIIQDANGDLYCVSCPHPTPTPSPSP